MSELLNEILSAVREAGAQMLAYERRQLEVFAKPGEGNFVTDCDLQNQKLLIARFRQLLPDAAFFGEEDTESSVHQVMEKGYTFIIDPIDGTTNYLYGYHHSSVSVGLAKDGSLVLGAVYDPFTDDLYWAEKGEGAYLNGKRLHVLPRGIKDGIAAFGVARYNKIDEDLLFALVRRLYETSLAIREGGTAAVDLCRVASNANVCFAEFYLNPYDYAAGLLILEEAGGIALKPDGTPIDISSSCGVLAGSREAVSEMLEMIKVLKKGEVNP